MNTINEMVKKIEEIVEKTNNAGNLVVKFYPKGMTATDEEESSFIKTSNEKYFNTNNPGLLGNFACVSTDSTSELKTFSRIYLDDLTSSFVDNPEVFEDVITENIKNINNISPQSNILHDLDSYEAVKDRLIIRPLNYENNKTSLEGMVYMKHGDIVLVLYIVVSDDNGTLNTAKVPVSIVNKWPEDKAVVLRNALVNTAKRSKAVLFTDISSAMTGADSGIDILSDDNTEVKPTKFFVPMVTTSTKVNGAVALFYPGVRSKLAKLLGGSYYVAFTSVHEAMVHPVDTVIPEHVRNSLASVNASFDKDETLTYECYMYDAEKETFDIVR